MLVGDMTDTASLHLPVVVAAGVEEHGEERKEETNGR